MAGIRDGAHASNRAAHIALRRGAWTAILHVAWVSGHLTHDGSEVLGRSVHPCRHNRGVHGGAADRVPGGLTGFPPGATWATWPQATAPNLRG